MSLRKIHTLACGRGDLLFAGSDEEQVPRSAKTLVGIANIVAAERGMTVYVGADSAAVHGGSLGLHPETPISRYANRILTSYGIGAAPYESAAD